MEREKNYLLYNRIHRQYGAQSRFARTVGMSEPMVSRVLYGLRTLTPEEQETWAKALNCSRGDLFTGE